VANDFIILSLHFFSKVLVVLALLATFSGRSKGRLHTGIGWAVLKNRAVFFHLAPLAGERSKFKRSLNFG
jgi:hypothetical protein